MTETHWTDTAARVDAHALNGTPNGAAKGTLKGWHVLMMMLGFFGVMFAVNGVFLFHAITSFPGEDVRKSYVQGLNYNDTLATRAAQASLGWQAEAGLRAGDLVLRLTDADGGPVSDMAVICDVRRHATNKADRVLAFQTAPGGEYIASGFDAEPGQWLLRFRVMDRDGETVVLNVDKTLLVP